MKTSKNTAEHYFWGDACSGWHLVNSKEMHIIKELMPPMTAEKFHYHEHAQQFFYILEGLATIVFEEKTIDLMQGEGIHILPKTKHQIKNNQSDNLRFLLISKPSTRGDRIEEPFKKGN